MSIPRYFALFPGNAVPLAENISFEYPILIKTINEKIYFIPVVAAVE